MNLPKFNLSNILDALSAGLPAIGQMVVALHPGDTPEEIKIAAGVQLVQILAASLHQVASTAPAAPAAAPAPAPEVAPAAQVQLAATDA